MTTETLCDIDFLRRLLRDAPYDPRRGVGCLGRRVRVSTPVEGLPSALVPDEMRADKEYRAARSDSVAWRRLRCRYDFEYWAWRCVRIHHKLTGALVPFALNAPQRRVLEALERQRLASLPIRLILLKARQWGGSTLIQNYMAWIQCVHKEGWNSLICAHVKNTLAAIRAMYSTMLANYPAELWQADVKPAFKACPGSVDTREIAGRGCTVTVSSSQSQEGSRGLNCAMAHLSEVAFWADSKTRNSTDYIRAVCSGIALLPYTLVAMESTANGTGNFFHREWLRAEQGASDKTAVFVPWYEIEIYRTPVADPAALWAEMDDYENELWRRGLTLEMLSR